MICAIEHLQSQSGSALLQPYNTRFTSLMSSLWKASDWFPEASWVNCVFSTVGCTCPRCCQRWDLTPTQFYREIVWNRSLFLPVRGTATGFSVSSTEQHLTWGRKSRRLISRRTSRIAAHVLLFQGGMLLSRAGKYKHFVTVGFSGICTLHCFFWQLFTFTIHLYTNICTFRCLHWKNMLVTALLFIIYCSCCCLTWRYLNYALV